MKHKLEVSSCLFVLRRKLPEGIWTRVFLVFSSPWRLPGRRDINGMFFWVSPRCPFGVLPATDSSSSLCASSPWQALTTIVCVLVLISEWAVLNGHISTCRRLAKLKKLASGFFCSAGNQKLGKEMGQKTKVSGNGIVAGRQKEKLSDLLKKNAKKLEYFLCQIITRHFLKLAI